MIVAKVQYLTIADVCEILQVCRKTVRRLVIRGELRPIRLRLGGSGARSRVRFEPDEIERFIARMRRSK